MKNNAFVFSIDAILALFVLLSFSFLVIGANLPNSQISDLIILQKEGDLLKVWCGAESINLNEMVSDFNFAFRGSNGEVSLNGEKIAIGNSLGKNAISSSAECFYPIGGFSDLTATVFN